MSIFSRAWRAAKNATVANRPNRPVKTRRLVLESLETRDCPSAALPTYGPPVPAFLADKVIVHTMNGPSKPPPPGGGSATWLWIAPAAADWGASSSDWVTSTGTHGIPSASDFEQFGGTLGSYTGTNVNCTLSNSDTTGGQISAGITMKTAYTATLDLSTTHNVEVAGNIDLEGTGSSTQSGAQTLTWDGIFTQDTTGVVGSSGATLCSAAAGTPTMVIGGATLLNTGASTDSNIKLASGGTTTLSIEADWHISGNVTAQTGTTINWIGYQTSYNSGNTTTWTLNNTANTLDVMLGATINVCSSAAGYRDTTFVFSAPTTMTVEGTLDLNTTQKVPTLEFKNSSQTYSLSTSNYVILNNGATILSDSNGLYFGGTGGGGNFTGQSTGTTEVVYLNAGTGTNNYPIVFGGTVHLYLTASSGNAWAGTLNSSNGIVTFQDSAQWNSDINLAGAGNEEIFCNNCDFSAGADSGAFLNLTGTGTAAGHRNYTLIDSTNAIGGGMKNWYSATLPTGVSLTPPIGTAASGGTDVASL